MERVAKSWVSNRSYSKKSNSGQVGIPKSRIRVFCRVSCTFYSKFYVLFHYVGRRVRVAQKKFVLSTPEIDTLFHPVAAAVGWNNVSISGVVLRH